MKKQVLRTKGYFFEGVFVVDKIYVPKGSVNIYGEAVKIGYRNYTFGSPLCGGKAKPAPQGTGDWFCVDEEWVWFPG